ncbi:hypothetical protein BKM31_37495 [[Actinomadura] parvosata subsp. kistnae]|uniref:Uncharacterized protein n=1 Tax=[Actinomadura] parvosata subsp. kistnae TaxID=1909395 RepID=A0A1V0A870_9ACTN|nr:hypothetical protein BKM31_37495 [Nonomuraea sp. ATCC 55076]
MWRPGFADHMRESRPLCWAGSFGGWLGGVSVGVWAFQGWEGLAGFWRGEWATWLDWGISLSGEGDAVGRRCGGWGRRGWVLGPVYTP